MAKLNMYEQQTTTPGVRADAQAFGAGAAQAMGQMGEVAMDLGMQIKRREDVIERVQLMNEFDQVAQQALQAVQDTEDIARKDTVDSFQQGLRQKAGDILKRHGGTSASRAELQVQIENQVGQYAKSAFAAQVKAQQQFIGRRVEQKANELASDAVFAPDKLTDMFGVLDTEIDMLGDALSPSQAAQYKDAGRAQIATGAIQNLLARGQFQSAKSMMENPEVKKYLTPDASRKFGIDVVVEERKAEVEQQRQNANVRRLAQLARRDLTPEEVQRARDLPERKNMSISDKITEYELVTGKPASQAVVNEFYSVDTANGVSSFGNSLQGRALQYVTDNSVAYANGMLSPDQARQYEVMYAEAYKPVERQDPATGQWTKITPTIPTFVTQALNQGRGYYGGVSAPAAPQGMGGGAAPAQGGTMTPGQQVQLTLPDGRTIGPATVGPDGTWSITDPNPTTPAPSQTPTTPRAAGESGRTIWERRQNVAGPVAAAKSGLNRVPGVGPAAAGFAFGEADVQQADADRTYVEGASRDLVRVLQNNPRFTEGERQAIEKEISIAPEIFRSQESFEAKLIGIAQSLADRKADAQRTLNAEVSIDERRAAMDRIAAIDNFMGKLGIPPIVRTEEEVQALPPGTRFMDSKGNEYTKR